MRDDVVVIGGGLAGLTAARDLARRGAQVRVLEARDRVGGRSLSEVHDGQLLELGAQWLGPTQDRAYALARELGLRTFPQYTRGTKRLLHRGRVSSFGGMFPKLPLLDVAEAGFELLRLDLMAKRVTTADPLRVSRAAAWDGLSLADWMRRHVHTAGARMLLTVATQVVLGVEPEDLSFLYFLFYLRGGGGLQRLVESRGGAQQDRIAHGTQALSRGLADQLGDAVITGSPVVAVEQEPSGPRSSGVRVRTAARAYPARFAILALAPAMAQRIAFSPELPAARRALHERMPMGSVIKAQVVYDTPFWRNQGLAGEAVLDEGPVSAVLEGSSPDGARGALVCFIAGDNARRATALTAGDRRAAVLRQLELLFGPRAALPVAYHDKDWIADRWSGGCYVGVMPPGLMTQVGAALREPVGRLHFAGTETATEWAGYLEGAIESGQRAAREVLARL